MSTALTLAHLRERWNDVLDLVEREDRISWMAFFDARLAAFDGVTLTLDYSDSQKLSGSHQFPETREKQLSILKSAMREVFEIDIEISQNP